MMLSTQVKRGWAIATEYHNRGKKVLFGGISTMLHAEETLQYADSIFLGESEGRMDEVMADLRNGRLKKFTISWANSLLLNSSVLLAETCIKKTCIITKVFKWLTFSMLPEVAVSVAILVPFLISEADVFVPVLWIK